MQSTQEMEAGGVGLKVIVLDVQRVPRSRDESESSIQSKVAAWHEPKAAELSIGLSSMGNLDKWSRADR